MTKTMFKKLVKELGKEFENSYRAGTFNGVCSILRKYHPPTKDHTTDVQILVTCECIRDPKRRKELIPLCFLSTARNPSGKFEGVAFGVMPSGSVLRIESRFKKR